MYPTIVDKENAIGTRGTQPTKLTQRIEYHLKRLARLVTYRNNPMLLSYFCYGITNAVVSLSSILPHLKMAEDIEK
jgi:hypothetical protein